MVSVNLAGIGTRDSKLNEKFRHKPQSPITSLAKSQVLAYRWNLRQVADETSMNLGTTYSSPLGSRCLRPMLYVGRSLRSSPRWGKPITWRREAVRLKRYGQTKPERGCMYRATKAQKHRPPLWVRQSDGKPDALKGARPVWGEGWRNVHIVRYATRSVPTPHDPSPSPEDISITRHLVQAGEMLSIPVLDHIILGRHRFVSLKERGLGFGD